MLPLDEWDTICIVPKVLPSPQTVQELNSRDIAPQVVSGGESRINAAEQPVSKEPRNKKPAAQATTLLA